MATHRATAVAVLVALGTLAGCSSTAPPGPVASPTGGSAASTSPTGGSAAPASPTLPAVVERHAGFVAGTRGTGDDVVLSMDLVLFLTGLEAEDAAEARGEEVPPPNDFFIVNDSLRLRDYPVDERLALKMVMGEDGTYCPEMSCPPLPLGEWLAALSGPAAETLLSTPYWFTLTDGRITALEQQYIP